MCKTIRAKKQIAVTTVLSVLMLSGCGSSEDDPFNDLRGTWTGSCATNDTGSERLVFNFTGSNNMTRSRLIFNNSRGCSDSDYESENTEAMITITGGTTQTSLGAANHMTIEYVSANLTASDIQLNRLESMGITLADVAASRGIDDIDDIPLIQIANTEDSFTIYVAQCPRLTFGLFDSEVTDGSTAERRPTELDLENDFLMLGNFLLPVCL